MHFKKNEHGQLHTEVELAQTGETLSPQMDNSQALNSLRSRDTRLLD
jgi:hypothetical protein